MSDEPVKQDNIAVFNLVTGMILADLYAAFPVVKNLGSFNVALNAGLVPNQCDIDYDADAVAAACIAWLIAEGIIRSAQSHPSGSHATGCVLTMKGLQLMTLPSVLDPQETLGEGLKKSLKAGLNEGVKQSVSLLVKTTFAAGGAWVANHAQ